MTDFRARFAGGALGALIASPVVGASGALLGYIYAKFADLSQERVAYAWAVWNVAETMFISIAMSFTEDRFKQGVIKAYLITLSTVIGIQELQKRELIGERMALFLITLRAFGVLKILIDAAEPPLPVDS